MEERSRREAKLAAERERQEKLEKMIKDAKGKEYTIDEEGNFILINQVRRADPRLQAWLRGEVPAKGNIDEVLKLTSPRKRCSCPLCPRAHNRRPSR